MCGIAGFVAINHGGPGRETLRRMCQTLTHRGPDDLGEEVVPPVGLGMRRLSIIDVVGGKQPIYNEDGSVRVTFNGEIYNFREIRKELEALGHRFRTNCDTEVLVHAYEEYGSDFPSRLNGMFAIALHDIRKKLVLLVRDHIGIKPLFYCSQKNVILWGSEIKAILAATEEPLELDYDAVGEFFSWEYVPGERTLFKQIRKLLPGHALTIDIESGRTTEKAFWRLPSDREDGDLSENEWCDAIDEAIRRAVKRQLVSDVPLGAFLSGGVDSSLVVAAMGPATTFSIGFDDPSYNELGFSRAVAEHLQVDHHTEVIKPCVVDHFEHLMHFMDDPIGDFSIFPTFLVSRLARSKVTVALSGDGGDELFGGYETYIAQQMSSIYDRVPRALRQYVIEPCLDATRPSSKKKGVLNKMKRFSEGAREPAALGHARWRIFLNESMRQDLFTQDALDKMHGDAGEHISRLYREAGDLDEINRALYVDVRSYLVDNCLVKTDRMSMATSLEARVPLLDTELVELAFRIPGKMKIAHRQTKSLLKAVAARHVPRKSVYRPKEGFSIPIKNWLGGQFRAVLDQALDVAKLSRQGIFNPLTLERLRDEHLAQRANHSHTLWSVIVFQAWWDTWLKGRS